VIVDEFREMRLTYKPEELYSLILSSVTDTLFRFIFDHRNLLNDSTEQERLFLSLLYKEFMSASTKNELTARLTDIQFKPWKRRVAKVLRWFRLPANFLLSTAATTAGDLLATALGHTPQRINPQQIKAMIPDFQPDISFNKITYSLKVLEKIAALAQRFGKKRVVIILDKLDEDQRLKGTAQTAAQFLRGVVTDNNLLLSDRIQTIVCLWSVAFELLRKDNVRTQKINTERLEWGPSDLAHALDVRLAVYSGNKIRKHENIFDKEVTDSTKKSIFVISSNPRDLWHAMDKIYREQFRINSLSRYLSEEAARSGLRAYVEEFNYREYYPESARSTSGARRSKEPDINWYVWNLSRVTATEFYKSEFSERARFKGQALKANQGTFYISELENMGLVVSLGQPSDKYRIRDPRIRYAIENGIQLRPA
jgi:hypothetical protein